MTFLESLNWNFSWQSYNSYLLRFLNIVFQTYIISITSFASKYKDTRKSAKDFKANTKFLSRTQMIFEQIQSFSECIKDCQVNAKFLRRTRANAKFCKQMQMFASKHQHFVSEWKLCQLNAKDLKMNTKFLGEMRNICKWTKFIGRT